MAFATFLKRHWAYAIGVCLLPVATVVYLIGLVSPYWSETTENRVRFIRGLWAQCQPGTNLALTNCRDRVSVADDWLRGTQFMQLMGVLLLCLSSLAAVVANTSAGVPHTRAVEVCSGFGGLFAVFSAFLYLASTGIPFTAAFPVTFSWGFALDMIGGWIALVATILIGCANKPRGQTQGLARRSRGLAHIQRRKMNRNWLQFYRPRKTAVNDRLALVPPIYWVSHV